MQPTGTTYDPSLSQPPLTPSGGSHPAIGWREWLALPDLGLGCLKCKIDTSRRASRLHATHLQEAVVEGERMVRFRVYPISQEPRVFLDAEAPVVGEHDLALADGRVELCPVIRTRLILGRISWLQDVLLIDQDTDVYRLVLGRHALNGRFLVDPSRSFVGGPPVLIAS